MLSDAVTLVWSRIDWLSVSVLALVLLEFVIGAAIVYCFAAGTRTGRRSLPGFIAYCLPRDIVLHPSARLDYGLFFAQKLTYPFILGPLVAAAVFAGNSAMELATATFGPPPAQSSHWLWSFGFTVAATLLVADFWTFWFHRLQHRVWWLWQFHKVHHSAAVLSLGVTGRRNHFVDEILTKIFAGMVFPGLVFGAFAYAAGADIVEVTVLGVDLLMLAKIVTFYKLRESHIPMRFPRLVERVLISPAQHQIHHSVDPRHYNKNFGSVFGLWDWLYGSWMRSEEEPIAAVGLMNGEDKEFNSLWRLYVLPFQKILRELSPNRRTEAALPR